MRSLEKSSLRGPRLSPSAMLSSGGGRQLCGLRGQYKLSRIGKGITGRFLSACMQKDILPARAVQSWEELHRREELPIPRDVQMGWGLLLHLKLWVLLPWIWPGSVTSHLPCKLESHDSKSNSIGIY